MCGDARTTGESVTVLHPNPVRPKWPIVLVTVERGLSDPIDLTRICIAWVPYVVCVCVCCVCVCVCVCVCTCGMCICLSVRGGIHNPEKRPLPPLE